MDESAFADQFVYEQLLDLVSEASIETLFLVGIHPKRDYKTVEKYIYS